MVVPARGTADQILAALPADVDAVYLTPYPALGEAQTARLIAGLGARRLPTLSHTADDVPAGALASYEPPEHWLRRARRVAVDLQRILAGEDAGTLPVRLIGAPRLTLNLATARTIGFSPGYSIRHRRGAGRHRLTRPGGHRVAGRCDARRRRRQSGKFLLPTNYNI